MINLFIKGQAIPQGRPRATLRHNGAGKPFVQMYDPETSRKWKEEVKRQAIATGEKPIEGAIHMELIFYMLKPKSLPKKVIHHVKKPDVDNLAKAVKDGMEGVFYNNDSQVCSLTVKKIYCIEHPGVRVTIAPVEIPA